MLFCHTTVSRRIVVKMANKKSNYFVENKNGACRLCTEPNGDSPFVKCEECDRYFHLACAKLSAVPTAEEEWLCIKCQDIKIQYQQEEKKSTPDQAILELAMVLQNNSLEASRHIKKTTLVNLPEFDGKPQDWPHFKKTFEDTTIEAGFSKLENLNRLQRFVKGEAEKAVRALLLDPQNVPAIMARLEEQFGRADQVYKELLKDVVKIKVEGQMKIMELSDALDNLVTNIKILGKRSYLNDPRLIDELLAKLSIDKQLNWAQHKASLEAANSEVTLDQFNDWMHQISKVLRSLPKRTERPQNKVNVHKYHNRKPPGNSQQMNIAQNLHTVCRLCKGQHTLPECENFLQKNISDRIAFTTQHHLCFTCLLSSEHVQRNCPLSKVCSVQGCIRRHHPLLHEVPQPIYYHYNDVRVYYQIVPITVRNGSVAMKTFAFLDAGSSLTLMEEDLANKLGLQGRQYPLTMTWTQNLTVEQDTSRRVQLTIVNDQGKEFLLKEVRTVKNLQLPQQTIDTNRLLALYPHLKGIKIESFTNAYPTILIGLSHSHLIMPLDRRMGRPEEPMAIKTKLGWIIFGNEYTQPATRSDHFMVHKNEEIMNRMIQQYFSTEDFGVKVTKPLVPKEIEQANKILEKTLEKKDGYYQVGLLWKPEVAHFPNSYPNALKRLVSLEKQLNKNRELQVWAKNTFADYIQKGYLRKLTPSQVAIATPKTFYLPHFVVVNRNKPIPKPRLVFDAAAEVNHISLNSQLLSGPDEMASLFGVLLRFREGNICVTGDIQEMFHRVRIREEDQDSQRILWRDCENRCPDVYVMQVMTFGATCSPACAQVVKNTNAAAHAETHPLVVDPIVRQHYVDDYLDSFFTMEDAIETVRQVIEVHKAADFHIRNFTSNRGELLKTIPQDRVQQKTTSVQIEEKGQDYEKILGVHWNSTIDHFGFQVKMNKVTKDRPTMREVLSCVMSVYDPLGLISHVTIAGRILMRELHVITKDWDSTIPDELQEKWEECLRVVKSAENIRIEAMLNSRPLTHIPLENEEDEILTPFHFLIGRNGSHIPPVVNETSAANRQQYKLTQHYSKIFWDRWKKEYLPTLIRRNKWTNHVEPIKVGDIVVLFDDNAPPGKWIKGRIMKANMAPDGQVRSVEVKVGENILKRPAVRVAVLNIEQKEHLLLHTTSQQHQGTHRIRPLQPNNDNNETKPPRKKTKIAPCHWAKQLLENNPPSTSTN
ncbi:uncharacterized protein LOC121594522 [Anopheles merus]|uniref:uncharacterized protein LOC121594522 n=1 Tax=Anopheles merus TaxID=30066 RepID=UPI001BE40FE2|nr:uncharacterized protein LOC121594522 [Anopheles merus]